MIQRIQTLYLFVALVLIVLMFFVDIVQLTTPQGDQFMLSLTGYYTLLDGERVLEHRQHGLSFMGGVMTLLTLATLLFYKKRVIQMRFCLYNVVLGIGLFAIIMLQIFPAKNAMDAQLFIKIPFVFPPIFAILSWLAFRGVRNDHILVTSIDRLRSHKKR